MCIPRLQGWWRLHTPMRWFSLCWIKDILRVLLYSREHSSHLLSRSCEQPCFPLLRNQTFALQKPFSMAAPNSSDVWAFPSAADFATTLRTLLYLPNETGEPSMNITHTNSHNRSFEPKYTVWSKIFGHLPITHICVYSKMSINRESPFCCYNSRLLGKLSTGYWSVAVVLIQAQEH